MQTFSRRQFFGSSALFGAGLLTTRRRAPGQPEPDGLDPERAARLEQRFGQLLEEHAVPGCAAGLLRGGRLVWSAGFGLADLERELPMTPDALLNIGSVTKTVTTTAVLQLLEEGLLNLDDDAGERLAFPVRNPRHPEVPITVRQLLTHRSSILDGLAYDRSYACGDPATPLGEWLAAYFTAERVEDHFHLWEPGGEVPSEGPRAYSNVAFGLLGHLVERVDGRSFEDYCRERIFEPLGMAASGFLLERIDVERHAVPYTRVPADFAAGDDLAGMPTAALARRPLDGRAPEPGTLFPHCLYSFATPPDGLLRTSVNELARFLSLWAGRGTTTGPDGEPVTLLDPDIVDLALADAHFGRALCWDRASSLPGGPLAFHDGGDPGILTLAGFHPGAGSGLLLFFNTGGPGDMVRAGLVALLEALAD